MSEREEKLEVLRQVHEFPGPYVFKVIGENTPDFIAQVLQAVVVVLGPRATPGVTTRQSSGGKHLSVTVRVQLEDAETVLRIYELLGKLPGVRFIL
jgi:putative lipoic acid-binding regulatory protein